MSVIDKQPPDTDSTQPADSQQLARQRAIEQIERQRHFHIEVVVGALGMILLVVIWAVGLVHHGAGLGGVRAQADLREQDQARDAASVG